MGRFSVETSLQNPTQTQPGQFNPNDWPTLFTKETIGIERNGIIIENQYTPFNIEEIKLIPNSCEAIRMMRLKGYRVVIFFNEPLISEIYSKPNNGMLKKAEKDFRVNFKNGYFVGDKIHDLKAGSSCGAKPILIKTGLYEETTSKLNTFANRELKKKTKEFNSLLDFAHSLS
jgi:histidinol phosphatase-like enzyme